MTTPLTGRGCPIGGLWLPLVTPLRDGYIDLDALRVLAHRYGAPEIAGLVLFGSTGEGSLMSDEEKILGFQAVREVLPHMPILLGAGGVDTRELCSSIDRLGPLCPDGWLVPPPYYLRPAPAGVIWHYRRVAQVTQAPVIVYDVPQRTGCPMPPQLLVQLWQEGYCTAVKTCDPGALRACPPHGGPPILCGDDAAFLDHFVRGHAGAITASAHIRPDLFAAVMAWAKAGREGEAGCLFQPLREVISLVFAEPNPAPLKHFLAAQGVMENELRLPMTPASEDLGRRLLEAAMRLPSKVSVRSGAGMTAGAPQAGGAGRSTKPKAELAGSRSSASGEAAGETAG
ncbi:MAG: dihydrodipicolinate synthase family protein [Pigmentiphaga sp.]|uniref:dihydrodipicolinate synthase family protein n=1 Tax=Pigmentiphaga sp. TaxID=1977564 RepID=UPI0029AB1604|nr:dihydrodipicolinate synthase family protein [Pigmentiphaga sp.]MDX3906666.1 dihydrodipicolinate synthase family protein [Pigmentiphaga sp.]